MSDIKGTEKDRMQQQPRNDNNNNLTNNGH